MPGSTSSATRRASGRNPFAPPRVSRRPPVLRWSEAGEIGRLGPARTALAAHCADPARLAADADLLRPRLRGLAMTVAALAATAAVIGAGIAGLAIILERDRTLLLLLAGVCLALTTLLGLTAARRAVRDRAQAAADRGDPLATTRAYLLALRSGRPGEAIARLCPTARARAIEAPQLASAHRSRTAYVLEDPAAMAAWTRTFARSDPLTPRWLYLRAVTLARREDDRAEVLVRLEVRTWALWGLLLVAGLFLPIYVLALIPGAGLYFLLRKRQPVVARKLLLRGSDGWWYLVRAEVAGE